MKRLSTTLLLVLCLCLVAAAAHSQSPGDSAYTEVTVHIPIVGCSAFFGSESYHFSTIISFGRCPERNICRSSVQSLLACESDAFFDVRNGVRKDQGCKIK